jgi:hypothetical protein
MLSLLLLTAIYFLPAIIGRDKKDALGIFLVNFFLGWTLIGWVVAFIWACAADHRPVSPAYLYYAPAGPGRFCSGCGTASFPGAHYCASCGRAV